jgi:WD40 repeat protein
MMLVKLFLATGALLTPVAAQAMLTKPARDFSKGGVPAQWAPGHPKTWGSEDFRYTLKTFSPSPSYAFEAAITSDDRYLVAVNSSHVEFTDLDKNFAIAATVDFGWKGDTPSGPTGLTVLPAAQGGYHVLFSLLVYPKQSTVRLLFSPDLKLVEDAHIYTGEINASNEARGLIALILPAPPDALSPLDGPLAVYDIFRAAPATHEPLFTLPLEGRRADLSLSPDGAYLTQSLFNTPGMVDVFNASSGETVANFPLGNDARGRRASVSADGQFLAIGTQSNEENGAQLRIYAVASPDKLLAEFGLGVTYPFGLHWRPDGKQILAVDNNRIRVLNVPSMEVVNTWEVDYAKAATYGFPDSVGWVDGGKKVTWVYNFSRYLYDVEENIEQVWAMRTTDRVSSSFQTWYLKKRGYVVNRDADGSVRFWKI